MSTDTEFSWCGACLLVTAIPILAVINLKDKYEEHRKKLEPINDIAANDERRSLSIEPIKSHSQSRRSLPWRSKPASCQFLEQLPAEIRQMIYIEVLGGHLFKISRRKRNLGHITCHHGVDEPCLKKSSDSLTVTPCEMYGAIGHGTWPPRKRKWLTGRDPDANLLALPKTCRQIYRESIEILYSHNTFNFPVWHVLTSFQVTVLPQRFDLLRDVVIDVDLSRLRVHGWADVWDQLARNRSLERVKIILSGLWIITPLIDMAKEKQDLIMNPLRRIKPRISYDIVLSGFLSEILLMTMVDGVLSGNLPDFAF